MLYKEKQNFWKSDVRNFWKNNGFTYAQFRCWRFFMNNIENRLMHMNYAVAIHKYNIKKGVGLMALMIIMKICGRRRWWRSSGEEHLNGCDGRSGRDGGGEGVEDFSSSWWHCFCLRLFYRPYRNSGPFHEIRTTACDIFLYDLFLTTRKSLELDSPYHQKHGSLLIDR